MGRGTCAGLVFVMRASRTVKLASATHRSSALEYSSRVRCGMSLLLSHMERIGGLSLRRAQTPSLLAFLFELADQLRVPPSPW